jgi:Phytanoyl-CoA dioxygenase (PhyH)
MTQAMEATMDISFGAAESDESRRARAYRGALIVVPPSPASRALVEHAREHIEASFEPRDPRLAHEELAVTDAVNVLSRLKPQFIHDPKTTKLLQALLVEMECDPYRTFQDVPRLRVAYPASYLSTGIAYAHHPHRDTWYSAPACQLNWWMPIYDFEADQGMAFHPNYWGVETRNSSSGFNYYRWNADGRKNAAQHVKSDTRVQPHAEETLELEPSVRLVVPAGGLIVFSAAQLHSTVRNQTSVARWSIDFRTVNLDDLGAGRGPVTADSASTGTSLRDFRRVMDLAPMPEEIVALHDTASVSDGVAVYKPAVNGAAGAPVAE